MKIELHETTKPVDALNDALAVMSYQRSLLAEIAIGHTSTMNSDETYGQIVLYRLLESLIDAAAEKQDEINATQLKAVKA